MYFSRDSDGAIVLNYGTAIKQNPVKMVIGHDDDGYIVIDYKSGESSPETFPNYGSDIFGERIITCTNYEGEAIILTEKRLDPFVLCKADGIYDLNNTVTISDNTMTDGGIYQGSIMKTRNIVLTLKDIEGHDANRELIDVIFDKSKPGILQVQDGTHIRSIEYYVESISTTATPVTRLTTISLLCPDPYFYDPDYTNVYIANLIPAFEFEHEFIESGEEIGYYNPQRLGTIKNKSARSGIGITIMIQALGHVVNPTITLIETQEYITLGTNDGPFTMNYGDRVFINTQTGKKNIYDINGESINMYMTENSTFFQILRGTNTIGYEADEGADNISLTITYRYQYMRA